jgi:hypothetical protein
VPARPLHRAHNRDVLGVLGLAGTQNGHHHPTAVADASVNDVVGPANGHGDGGMGPYWCASTP